MAENKTKETKASVDKFMSAIKNENIRMDCYTIIKIMKYVTKEEPKMWGSSIIGFGTYHYKYASGREGDICIAWFSPRKQNLTIYLEPGFEKQNALLEKIGNIKQARCVCILNL